MTFIPLWANEHCDALRKHVDDGYSFSQIAKFLNDEFGTSYTRKAAIGKACRLGLVAKKVNQVRAGQAMDAVKKIKRVRKAAPKVSSFAGTLISTGGGNNGIPIDRESDPAPLRCAEVEPLNISFNDLSSENCHWPFGTELPFLFCGHRALKDHSYCIAHMQLSTGRGTVLERQAHHLSAREVA